MNIDERFTRAFTAYLSGNKGPDGEPAEYGISAEGDESSNIINLTLVFKPGIRYCCSEWDCHLGTCRPGGWDALRRVLLAAGIAITSNIELRLKVVVEEGAFLFMTWETVPGRREYEHTVREGEKQGFRVPDRPPNYSGIWTRYGPDGRIMSEASYLNGRLHGRHTSYGGMGQKHRESYHGQRAAHGTATQWNSKGEIIDVSEWDHGTGTFRIFYSSGQLCSEHQQRSGKSHGVTRYWNGKGVLICTEYYEDGRLVRQEGKPPWRHLCAFQTPPSGISASGDASRNT